MKDLLPDPPRWKNVQGQANLAERTAGEVIRAMPQADPLDGAQLAAISATVQEQRPHRSQRWVFALAAFLLGIATTASAAHWKVIPAWLTGAKPEPATDKLLNPARKARSSHAGSSGTQNVVTPEKAPEPAAMPESPAPVLNQAHMPRKHRSPTSASEQPESVSPPAQVQLPSVALDPVLAKAPQGTRLAFVDQPAPPASPAAAPSIPPQAVAATPRPSVAGGAGKHLAETIRILRVAHDPRAALVLLDTHAAALEKNKLGHEALLLRVEALLALDRRGEVLRLLDGVALSDVAASHSLLLTRGRLRAEASRCADGVGDFDLILAESNQPERQALFGRAICRKQIGNLEGARADLERYRREFPSDPRLGELEKRLGALP